MRILLYTHSLVSDWNHGNAHFLRGILRELVARGHQTLALEPEAGWSRGNLLADQGVAALTRFRRDFPELTAETYGPGFDHEAAVADADLVLVHEWTDAALIERLGRARRLGGGFTLLFHDTHHRAVSAEQAIAALPLEDYDGVLAFGETLRQRYLKAGWGARVFTWHEAADLRLFKPDPAAHRDSDLIWVGNWGDGERSRELAEFLVEPARALRISGRVRGVRYPLEALRTLREAGLIHGGWIANADVPAAFAQSGVTLHVPRRPYVEALPGIPTIRVFEALACGIPLISAPWDDCENLFRSGRDFLTARNGKEMQAQLSAVLRDRDLAAELGVSGRETIEARHSCAHRVDQLFEILAEVGTQRLRAQLPRMEAAQ